jgi:hypothetical protein
MLFTAETYINSLLNAAAWALDPQRPAWQRLLQQTANRQEDFPPDLLLAAKETLRIELPAMFENWFSPLYAEKQYDETVFFDPALPPEKIWKSLFMRSEGIFSMGEDDPMEFFIVRVSSAIPGNMPIVVAGELDGWGRPVK